MNNKLRTEELIKSVMERYNVSQKAAEYLVRIALSAIEDCIVKFGTDMIELAVSDNEAEK